MTVPVGSKEAASRQTVVVCCTYTANSPNRGHPCLAPMPLTEKGVTPDEHQNREEIHPANRRSCRCLLRVVLRPAGRELKYSLHGG
jgi:hypothetical protein